jgi:virginiamycin B lyase
LACAAFGTALVLAIATSASAAPTITEFPITGGNGPQAMTLGPDGNVWFIDVGADRIVRVTPDGMVTPFSVGSNPGLEGITAGPNGEAALYFTESNNNKIGRITTSGAITESSAMDGNSDPHGITAGPNGDIWFTEGTDDEIGRIAAPASLVVSNQYSVPGVGNNPRDITLGSDGNLWFTERTSAGGIGRVTPAGIVTEFGTMTVGLPTGIAAGADGNLWFAASGTTGAIGKITTSGTITQFTSGLTPSSAPLGIVAGADGNLYFTENANAGNRLGQITTSGVITEFTGLTAASGPWGIANGADGNIWFTENAGNRVGRLNFPPAAVTDPATLIHASDATLAGTVTPRSQATTYSFDWGLTNGYGSSTATTSAGSGASAQPVTALISSLVPATTYHFRVVATNAAGTTLGADRSFTTLAAAPVATTATASLVGETSATLNADVTPNGATTTYHFEFGLTAGYGDRVPASEAAVGADTLPHALQQTLGGLVPGTTYHYRVVATNSVGTTYGGDQLFTTVAPAPFVLPVTLPAPVVPIVASGLPPATAPVLGQSAKITATSGEILVQLPGTGVYLPLSAASTVPVGTTIDATHGTLKLTNVRNTSGKLQTGTFWGGSFTFRQTGGKETVTVLTLAAPLQCPKSRHLASATANKPRARQLWGKDNNGRFVTRGRSAVATVRGTAWFTRDTCAGTLVKVTRGTVAVRDLVRKVTVIVHAGHQYVARLR